MTVAQYAHANRVTACYQKMNTNSCHYEIFFKDFLEILKDLLKVMKKSFLSIICHKFNSAIIVLPVVKGLITI